MTPNAPAGSDPADRVPFAQTLLYGIGQMAHQIFDSGVGYLAFYVFNISLGVSPVLVGVAQAVSRGVDLFTDPMAGYLSDSMRRHKWALRVLICAGTILGGVCFAMIWLFPSGLTPSGYFIWLLAAFSLASAGWSFCSIPRQALGFEMTRDTRQRGKLMATASFMALLCNLSLAWSYAATQLPLFKGTVDGSRWVGSAMGLGIIVLGLPFAFFYRVPASPAHPELTAADQLRSAGSRDFREALGRVRRCRPFLILTAAVALVIIGMLSTAYGVCHCIALYYLCGGSQPRASIILGGGSTAWIVAGMVFTAPTVWLSRRIGKKEALMAFLSVSMVGALLKWFCYNPRWPWLYVVPHAMFGMGIGAVGALVPAMTADVCDVEESLSGSRDSGLFSAFYNWTIKLGISISIALSGLLLNLTGFNVARGADQGAPSILHMRLLDMAFPVLSIGLAVAVLSLYPITAGQIETVRAALDGRKAARERSPDGAGGRSTP
jgi:glycoside/pentoside/hexuronide:cation symporter, GPH family